MVQTLGICANMLIMNLSQAKQVVLKAIIAQLKIQAACLMIETCSAQVERGTTPDERMVYGPLSKLSEHVKDASLESPTLVVIGDVVGLSPGWRKFTGTGQSLQEGGEYAFLPRDTNYIDYLYQEGSQLKKWESHI